MTSRAEIYEQQAAVCRTKAEAARSRAIKITFLELARKWAAMAEEIEKQEREQKESVTPE
jgi:hypothetical protein